MGRCDGKVMLMTGCSALHMPGNVDFESTGILNWYGGTDREPTPCINACLLVRARRLFSCFVAEMDGWHIHGTAMVAT